MQSFDAVYARMLFAAGIGTQAELAELIGIRQASISDAKKRGNIPTEWCMRLYDVRGVHVDWQRQGMGPVYDNAKIPLGTFIEDLILEEPEPAVNYLAEYDDPSFLHMRSGDMPYHDTREVPGVGFFELGRQIFPLESLQGDVQVFRVSEMAMEPVLNSGALVVVRRDVSVKEGELAAVLYRHRLLFRRVHRTASGYELHTENPQNERAPWLISAQDWDSLYYGKAVWVVQPLK